MTVARKATIVELDTFDVPKDHKEMIERLAQCRTSKSAPNQIDWNRRMVWQMYRRQGIWRIEQALMSHQPTRVVPMNPEREAVPTMPTKEKKTRVRHLPELNQKRIAVLEFLERVGGTVEDPQSVTYVFKFPAKLTPTTLGQVLRSMAAEGWLELEMGPKRSNGRANIVKVTLLKIPDRARARIDAQREQREIKWRPSVNGDRTPAPMLTPDNATADFEQVVRANSGFGFVDPVPAAQARTISSLQKEVEVLTDALAKADATVDYLMKRLNG